MKLKLLFFNKRFLRFLETKYENVQIDATITIICITANEVKTTRSKYFLKNLNKMIVEK